MGKHLPRRTFLRGLGSAIGLPLLDAMAPAWGASKQTKSPIRFAVTYVPNGIIMNHWTPNGTGADFEFTRILKPLAALQEDLFVLTGLAHHTGNGLGDGSGDHARAGATFLTGVHPRKTMGADIRAGISVDQIAARASGSQTRFASIEVGCEDTRTVGNCDSGYSCAYTNSISWRGAATPNPPESNPRLVFERLFGIHEASLDSAARARMAEDRKSILDMSLEDSRRLIANLGAADRRKLDEYFSAIRDIEKRMETGDKDHGEIKPTIEKPSGIPVNFSEYVKLMFDLQVLAFQADLTRVCTFMIARESSVRTYPEIGVPDGHHPLTHHRNDPEWIEKVTKINLLHTEFFSYFLQKLKSTPDGDGTLLDHSMIVYGSGISDGNLHKHEDLPVLLAGRASGSLKPGRHIVYRQETPMTNLYLTLLDRVGVRPESIGDSTGKLEHLSDL